MGIPIEFPSSPSPRFTPSHSAKPSWSFASSHSNGYHHYPLQHQHYHLSSSSSSSAAVATASSSSSTSTSSYSSRNSQLNYQHDTTQPPLSTFAYVPPPPTIWGISAASHGNTSTNSMSQLVESPLPISPSSAYVPFPALAEPVAWTRGSRVEAATGESGQATAATSLEEEDEEEAVVDIEMIDMSSVSPTRLPESTTRTTTATASRVGQQQQRPNFRGISRAPVFVSTSSRTPLGGITSTTRLELNSAASTTTTRAGPQQHYYSEARAEAGRANVDNRVWNPASPSLENYLTRPLPPPPPTAALQHTYPPSSSSLPRNSTYQTSSATSSSPSSLAGQQPQATWNHRIVNVGHADNRTRADILGRIGYGTSGYYYEDQRLRSEQFEQQQQQQQREQNQRLYRLPRYDTLSSSITSTLSRRDDPLYRNRFSPQDEATLSRSVSNPPLSPLSPSLTSALSSTALPSFLQGLPATARTVIRAHAVHQGVIEIHSDNHEPIFMYGRPILSSSSSSKSLQASSSASRVSSESARDDAVAAGTRNDSVTPLIPRAPSTISWQSP
ncbi:hypothetical protein BGZ98_003561, partial [Dissophora globulifera]